MDQVLGKLVSLANKLDAAGKTSAAEQIDDLIEAYASAPTGFAFGGQHVTNDAQLLSLLNGDQKLIKQLVWALMSSPKLKGDKALQIVFAGATPETVSPKQLADFLVSKGLLEKAPPGEKGAVQRGLDWVKQQWESAKEVGVSVPTLTELLGVERDPNFQGGLGSLSNK
jgi:hypothetical protein